MSDVLLDLRTRLGTVPEYPGLPVELGRVPDSPDELVALRSYIPGAAPKDLDGRGLPVFDSLGVQLVARTGKDAGAGRAVDIATRAYRKLVGRHVTIGSARYDWILANHYPVLTGFDENDRPLVVVNFRVQRWGDLSVAAGLSTGDTTFVTGDTTAVTGDAAPIGAP